MAGEPSEVVLFRVYNFSWLSPVDVHRNPDSSLDV